MTDTEFSQAVNPQSFCTGVSLHHPALIQNTGPLIDMSDIRPGTSECVGLGWLRWGLYTWGRCGELSSSTACAQKQLLGRKKG